MSSFLHTQNTKKNPSLKQKGNDVMSVLAFKKLIICPLQKSIVMAGYGVLQHWISGIQSVLHHTFIGCKPSTYILALCDPRVKCICFKTEDIEYTVYIVYTV